MRTTYSSLPYPLRRGLAHIFVSYRKSQIAKLKTPTVLSFFVTSRCNARCAHCFYWQEVNKAEDELALSEIETIAASLDKPVYLSLTGGEPTLRKDLVDIFRVFHRVNNSRNMGFGTNGLLPDRTESICRDVVDGLPLESFGVQVSLDGLAETHARIRGVRGGFQKALETVGRLSKLAQEKKSFTVRVNVALQKHNLSEIETLIDTLLPFEIPIQFALVRGQSFGTYALPKSVANDIDPKEPECPVVDLDTLDNTFAKIAQLNNKAPYRFWSDLQQKKTQVSLRMMREKRRQYLCYAGRVEGVLYSNGDVALCELTRPIGNIRDFNCNFGAIWNSDKSLEYRDKIKNCFCIHGCNLITSLMLDPDSIAAPTR